MGVWEWGRWGVPSLNFKAEFADAVESGEKRQTIRRRWRRPIQKGDDLYLYTGLRTKAVRLLGMAICESEEPIRIQYGLIEVAGCVLGWGDRVRFIRADGFERYRDFFLFFERQYGLPFEGVLIRW